jgi:hypothetical protein
MCLFVQVACDVSGYTSIGFVDAESMMLDLA